MGAAPSSAGLSYSACSTTAKPLAARREKTLPSQRLFLFDVA
jgi:hypothetical protein